MGAAIVLTVGAYIRGHSDGQESERLIWQERESEQLRLANAEIVRLNDEARALEQAGAKRIATLAEQHEKEKARAKANHDKFLDDLLAGRIRLYDPGRTASAGACPSAASATAATAGGGDGEARSELSPALARFLVGEAQRADEVVQQLTLAQGVIEEDRRICK